MPGVSKEMVITARWIHAHKTKNGAWTRRQLAAIGIDWPPEKGWIGRVLGREISEDQRRTFVEESAQAQSRLALENCGE